ncbi:MAG: hypothetical protein PHI49_00860 [Halothiobacillaceae bacterium]|jgi:hypothetical protein|nr:hypothetical protein [Halothiobacillaceae bacterium]MDY0049112.1 hypothetical protein [Halothiobacillaceae bacterium]
MPSAKRQIAALTATLLLAAPWATAEARGLNEGYVAIGEGTRSCLEFVQTRGKGGINEQRFITWLEGYLSAVNLTTDNTWSILGARDLRYALNWLEGHCRQNPTQAFSDAAAALTVQLYPGRYNMPPTRP